MKSILPPNLILFSIQNCPSYTDLSEALVNQPFTKTNGHCTLSMGFRHVITSEVDPQLLSPDKSMGLIRLTHEERKISSGQLATALEDKLDELASQGVEIQEMSNKDIKALKEELSIDLMNHIPPIRKDVFAYIDYQEKMLIVGAASASTTDNLVSSLRDALGSFSVSPFIKNTDISISNCVSEWIANPDTMPPKLSLGDKAQFVEKDEGAKISTDKISLDSDLKRYLDDCRLSASKIGLVLDDLLSFQITDDLDIKSIKLLDPALEDLAEKTDECEDQFSFVQANLLLSNSTLRTLISTLKTAFSWKEDT